MFRRIFTIFGRARRDFCFGPARPPAPLGETYWVQVVSVLTPPPSKFDIFKNPRGHGVSLTHSLNAFA